MDTGNHREHVIVVKSRPISGSEWLSWRKRGLSNADIASMLGISPSMARLVAQKFREAGVYDPYYWKRKPGPLKKVDTTTDAGAYLLGILWGTVALAGDNAIWVRHNDKWYVDAIREYMGIGTNKRVRYLKAEKRWGLRITRAAEVGFLKELLENHGWAPRNTPERPYPYGVVNGRGFVRAWVELHSSADIARPGRRRRPTPRLRIYGNCSLIDGINRVIAAETELGLRKPQRTPKETTVALYYTGKSFCSLVGWLYACASLYNPEAKERFEHVVGAAKAMRRRSKISQ